MKTFLKAILAAGALSLASGASAGAAELGKTSYWMVFSNPVEGREADYNDWYVGQHMKDITALKGVLSAQFFRLDENAPEPKPPVYRYVIIYEVRSDAVADLNAQMAKGFKMEMGNKPGDVVIDFSRTMGAWYKPITNKVSKEEMTGKTKQQLLDYARKPK